MNDADTTERSWTLSAPTLSPSELDTALARALGPELAAAKADLAREALLPYSHVADRMARARRRVTAIAMDLAEHGMSADTIRAAMIDMAVGASKKAARLIEVYDAEQDELARADVADEYDQKLARIEELAGRESALDEAGE